MIESSVARGPRHTFFGRLEIVQKPAEDLHAHEYIRLVFTVGKMVAGYTRYWAPGRGLQAGVGGIVMLSAVPVLLAPRYDGRIVPGFGLLLHVRPAPSAP